MGSEAECAPSEMNLHSKDARHVDQRTRAFVQQRRRKKRCLCSKGDIGFICQNSEVKEDRAKHRACQKRYRATIAVRRFRKRKQFIHRRNEWQAGLDITNVCGLSLRWPVVAVRLRKQKRCLRKVGSCL